MFAYRTDQNTSMNEKALLFIPPEFWTKGFLQAKMLFLTNEDLDVSTDITIKTKLKQFDSQYELGVAA
jgi:hypothetical protein